ncbi:Translation initiation factor eIF-2B subunit gamma [Coemansia interrupta]|uniref:Translation initiation factor eIF2B subunit gamma n=1 Tax=Coemansia interrupta TaxID=1126814 RepID=A0A9W8HMH0_9FUNG|nr:Translation initiation factor eIF-2B subunit gamma [Coemansia interrupta]
MFASQPQSFDTQEPELKAIVLTVPDNDMYPLTERENMTKALLPIANKPMLWYILQWLEQGGVLDIKIVATRDSEPEIANYIEVYKGMSTITVKGLSDVSGTADALRQVAPQIKGDVIVVPCDLLIDVPAVHFLDLFRIRRPAISTLFYEAMPSEGGGGSTRANLALPIIGIDQPTSRLVLHRDIDVGKDRDERKEMRLPLSLVRRFPSMAVSDKMQDSHIYVMQKWVLDYIVYNNDIESLQDDLIPLLVRAQCDPELQRKSGISKFIHPANPEPSVAVDDIDTAQFGLPDGARASDANSDDPLKVFVYVRRGGIAGRADQIPRYCDLNYIATKISTESRIDETARLASKTQVGTDSLVGASTQIGERCSIKRSVVGAHCVIGRNVKIVNSVIMDHVTIGDGVKIESCVVCKLTKIGEDSQLNDCEIGAKVTIPSSSELKGNSFTV